MIYFFSSAYNAEKTLRRAVESVLNQTEPSFRYYLLDNGSNDGTRHLIEEYAKSDDRIIPLYKDINHMQLEEKTSPLIELLASITKSNGEGFFVLLDADDEYKPDFLKKMLAFMEVNHLDIAACGNDYINRQTGSLISVRKMQQNLILEGTDSFGKYFPQYHQFMRTVWCKVYSLAVLQKCTYSRLKELSYGTDTMFAMEAFCKAKRVGILAESLHKYHLSPNSVSYQLNPKRIMSDRILHEITQNFLLDKAGVISQQNRDFLYQVYLHAIEDTLRVILKNKAPTTEKLQNIREVFAGQYTQALLCSNNPAACKDMDDLCFSIAKWMISQQECRKGEGLEIAIELLSLMYEELALTISPEDLKYLLQKMPEIIELLIQKDYESILERLHTWYKRHDVDVPVLASLEITALSALGRPDDEIFKTLIEIKKNRKQSAGALGIDSQIETLLKKTPLLSTVSPNLASIFSKAIGQIINEDYAQAFNAFVSVQNAEIDDSDIEQYLVLGQNLSAIVDNMDAYIYFKKELISFLLDNSRNEQASRELDEWEQILPDDEDFIALRKRLSSLQSGSQW